jgi:hypothetical protein
MRFLKLEMLGKRWGQAGPPRPALLRIRVKNAGMQA